MSQSATYVFRELTLPADLRASFALRYAGYSRTQGLSRLDSLDLASRHDVDGFDRYSRHFGVFEHSGAEKTLLGCLRVTGLDVSRTYQLPSNASSVCVEVRYRR
jgi:putative hemolysin